jgi:RHS repeat-associated protein
MLHLNRVISASSALTSIKAKSENSVKHMKFVPSRFVARLKKAAWTIPMFLSALVACLFTAATLAHAQDASATDPQTDTAATMGSDLNKPDGPSMQAIETTTVLAAGAGEGEANNSAIPGSVGSLNYNVDSLNGTFGYQIPIVVPPARQGAQPKLQLSYGSGIGNGWCGMGWALDIGKIERDTRNGPPAAWNGQNPSQAYDDNKSFTVSMAGARGRLVLTRTDEYRLEIQTSRLLFKLDRANNRWVVTDATGNKFYFGQADASRAKNSRWPVVGNGLGQTFCWALDQVTDVNGNDTLISWQTDSGTLYPARIDYNGSTADPSLGHQMSVVFALERRTDTNWNFRAGFWMEQSLRLKTIETYASSSHATRYEIAYVQSPSTGRSLLQAISVFGSDNTSQFPAPAVPAVTFDYNNPSLGLGDLTYWQRASAQALDMPYIQANAIANDNSYSLLDLDGDGRPDRVWRQGTAGNFNWQIEKNTGSSFAAQVTYSAIDNDHAKLGIISSEEAPYAGFGAIAGHVTYELAIDINGDGLVDRIACSKDLSKQFVQLNTGSGLGPLTEWLGATAAPLGLTKETVSGDNTDSTLLLIDMNGDGKPDRVYVEGTACKVQFNTGSAWAPAITWGGFTGTYLTRVNRTTAGDAKQLAAFIDLNGDGMPERVVAAGPPNGNLWTIQYNLGYAFSTPATDLRVATSVGVNCYMSEWIETPQSLGYSRSLAQGIFDWNADGFPDRLSASAFYYNGGKYFSPSPKVPTHRAIAYKYHTINEAEDIEYSQLISGTPMDFLEVRSDLNGQSAHIDLNGDGLPDFVCVLKNTSGWSSAWVYMDDPGFPPSHDANSILFSGQSAGSTVLISQLSQGQIPDLLTKVTSALGGSVAISYVPSTTFPNDDAQGRHLLPFPVYVASEIKLDDGFGNQSKTTYTYSGGFFDGVSREFRGFHKVEAVDPYGLKTVTYFHQGGGYDGSALGEYVDSYGKKGVAYKVEVYGTDGVLVSRVLNKVEVSQPDPGVYFPYLSQTIKMDFADATHYRATAEQLTYDPATGVAATGNVFVDSKLGEVRNVDLANHTFADVDPNDTIRTETSYKQFTGNSDIVNKPDVVTVSKGDLTDPHKTRFNYDSRGNLTSVDGWLASESRWVPKGSTQYNTLGNPWQTTDVSGVVTELTYDATYKMFPLVKKIAPGRDWEIKSMTSFDARSGLVLRATNHLGVIVQNDYDPFFRLRATYVNQQPLDEPTLWRTRADYTLGGISGTTSNNKVHQQIYDPNDTANGIETFTYLDGLGRKIQVRTESEVANTYRCTDVFHDDSLKDNFAPYPYFGLGSAYSANTAQQVGALTEYDASGRVFKVTPAAKAKYLSTRQRQGAVTLTSGDTGSPVSASTKAYSEGTEPWVLISIDAASKTTKAYSDAFGRVTNIVNVTSDGDISTKYGYDLMGNLVTVTDTSNNRTTVSYDSLGRKTSITDPDMGAWSYYYDDASRLTEQWDAKSQHIHFLFEGDKLGRIWKKQIYDGAGTLKREVEYKYDSPLEAGGSVMLGQLSSVTDTSKSCNCIGNQRFWNYDYKGRVLNENLYSWPFGSFRTSYAYNDADQVTDLTYPNDVARIRHTYQNGILKKIQSLKGTGTASETFYELTGVNEFGQTTEYLTHNGQVKTTQSFYDNSRRLQTLSVAKGSTDILKKTYGFDAVSNIKSITDGVSSHTGSASGTITGLLYDDLHRLKGLTDASASRSYTYDNLGNLTKNGDWSAGTYSYGSKPHAVTGANGKIYGYDNNGNMINRNGQTLVYDEENRLIQVVNGSILDVHFGYDYAGTRLWKFNKNNNQYTCFVSPLYEYRESDAAGLCYVYAGGQRIAAFRPTSDVYNLAGVPFSWTDRFLASLNRVTNLADHALVWALSPARLDLTLITLAISALLGILFATPRLTGVRIEKRELRFYVQPLWCRALTFLMIPVLLLATTEAHAAFTPGEVFYYFHGDHLGSSNITTDRSGNVIKQYEYKSYGADRNVVNNAAGYNEYNLTYRYTGQALDEDTGLYFYNSRYYDPELGRFVQADTLVPSPGDAQTLNRYSYCGNNPLKYVDPSGHLFGVDDVLIGVIMGAAIGGATAAIRGGDVGLGILTGVIGGVSGGIGAAAGGSSGAAGAFVGAVAGGAVGGAAAAAVAGGDVGMGALAGAISAVVSFGVSQLNSPNVLADVYGTGWGELIGLGSYAAGGGLGGGFGSVLQGGDFLEGAKYGAISSSTIYGAMYFLKWNNGPLAIDDKNIGHHAAQLLGRVWNLPNTTMGLVWAGLGKVLAWNTMQIGWDQNGIKVENNPLVGAEQDLTIGNVVSYGGVSTEKWDFYDANGNVHYEQAWNHTLPHTFQGQQLGPLYLPLHAFGQSFSGVMALLTNDYWERTDRTYNPVERGPYHWPPTNW